VRRCLIDTAVFLYAVGREHPYRDPCRRIVDDLGEGRIAGEASVSMVQEFAHVRRRGNVDAQQACVQAAYVSGLCSLHAFKDTDLPLMLELLAAHPTLDGQDAVFAATALNRGIDAIIATDRAFDDVPGLERIDPADVERVEELAR
jgi:predicted nucleic acid-binding protein